MAYVYSPCHNLVSRLNPSGSLTRKLYHTQISLRERRMPDSIYQSYKELISGNEIVRDGRPSKEFNI